MKGMVKVINWDGTEAGSVPFEDAEKASWIGRAHWLPDGTILLPPGVRLRGNKFEVLFWDMNVVVDKDWRPTVPIKHRKGVKRHGSKIMVARWEGGVVTMNLSLTKAEELVGSGLARWLDNDVIVLAPGVELTKEWLQKAQATPFKFA